MKMEIELTSQKIVIRNYEHMQRNGCSRRNLQITRYIHFIKTESIRKNLKT